ncbi:hypothetical protein [Paenibacillus sp. LK1]|uniref:hypothetical protein n=1 Tax=Paenibacillus sp. LK1 TaxID=2053014 RepID=UPI000C197F13|nr:hypothetical protein [Paenibacillus sp. LK1]PIH58265.1 hypothetical protein CS562_17495 [Paenibacillus sp. LK1]
MRKFGLTYDDAIAIQSSLVAGLIVQRQWYDFVSHDMSSVEKNIAKVESKRAMKKIAYLNGFTKSKSKAEIRKLGKLVVE